MRRFDDAVHGYGYVDALTPELSIAVVPEYRGVGIGRCLMTSMLVELRLHGNPQVSLSVETDNPALQLYKSLGFVARHRAEGSVTMIRHCHSRSEASLWVLPGRAKLFPSLLELVNSGSVGTPGRDDAQFLSVEALQTVEQHRPIDLREDVVSDDHV